MKIKMLLFIVLSLNINLNTPTSPDEDKYEKRNIIVCCFDESMHPIGKVWLKVPHFKTTIKSIKSFIAKQQKCLSENITLFTANSFIDAILRNHTINVLNDELTLKQIWLNDGSNFWAMIQTKKS